MRYKIKAITIVILINFLIIALYACKKPEQALKTDFNNTVQGEVAEKKEQSDIPYLGDEEITPLFTGRNNIGDWIKDVKAEDAECVLYTVSKTDDACFNVISSSDPEYIIASLYVEKNNYAGFLNNETGRLTNIPDEVKKLKVTEVIYVDFEKMGINFNVRDIIKGSSADDVKKAFLNMDRKIDTAGVPYQELYDIKDVHPNINTEPDYENYSLIRGFDTIYIEQRGFREITYNHAKFYENEDENYSVWHSRSTISFLIDDNGKVTGLTFEKTNRNKG